MSSVLTTADLFASDEQLKASASGLLAKYGHAADAAAVERVRAALEAKKHNVVVVDDAAAALEAVKKLIPEGATVASTGSTTLQEIGYTALSASGTAHFTDLRGLALAEKDQAKAAELRRQSAVAPYVITSLAAITENGDLLTADATATRTGPFLTGGAVIAVVGAQKIVPDVDAGLRRINEWCFQVESARVRAVYKMPQSSLNNIVVVEKPNSWFGPSRFTIVLVRTALGY